jgi:hypothetical protein
VDAAGCVGIRVGAGPERESLPRASQHGIGADIAAAVIYGSLSRQSSMLPCSWLIEMLKLAMVRGAEVA